jgi:hypothetical protein
MDRLDPHPGALLERCGDASPRGMVVHDRTRLNGRLRHPKQRATAASRCTRLAAAPSQRSLPAPLPLSRARERARGEGLEARSRFRSAQGVSHRSRPWPGARRPASLGCNRKKPLCFACCPRGLPWRDRANAGRPARPSLAEHSAAREPWPASARSPCSARCLRGHPWRDSTNPERPARPSVAGRSAASEPWLASFGRLAPRTSPCSAPANIAEPAVPPAANPVTFTKQSSTKTTLAERHLNQPLKFVANC